MRLASAGLSTTAHPPERLEALELEVPGDFSSAAFFIVAGLLAAAAEGLLLQNVGLNPTRTGLLDILRSMGGEIEIENPRLSGAEPVADLRVHASSLRGVVVPASLVPLAIDEFPMLFIAAACARGETVITGAEELRVKESDRIAAMSEGLTALGSNTTSRPTACASKGRADGPAFGGGEVDSHRAIIGWPCPSALRVCAPRSPSLMRDVANVATSFPGFVQLARSVGLDYRRIARLRLSP